MPGLECNRMGNIVLKRRRRFALPAQSKTLRQLERPLERASHNPHLRPGRDR